MKRQVEQDHGELHISSVKQYANLFCVARFTSVSVLRQLKMYMRSTMDEQGLTGLALMSVNSDSDISLDRRINKYIYYEASMKDKVKCIRWCGLANYLYNIPYNGEFARKKTFAIWEYHWWENICEWLEF